MDDPRKWSFPVRLAVTCAAGALSWLWATVSASLLVAFLPRWFVAKYSYFLEVGDWLRSLGPTKLLVLLLVIAPFKKEWLFRGPLIFFENSRPLVKVLAVAVLSAAFGYVHGGIVHIAVQGVSGAILAVVFFFNGPRPLPAYLSCVAAHLIHNVLFLCFTYGW